MKKKEQNSGSGGIVALVAGAAVLLVGGLAYAAHASKADADADGEAPKVPTKPWTPGPGGKGKIYAADGTTPSLPPAFDFGGNRVYIDPMCQWAIEGNLFWPTDEFLVSQIEAETLEEVLAIEGNSALGYVDYLVGTGVFNPALVAWSILEQLSVECAAREPETWGPGLQAWYNSLLERVTMYMSDAGVPLEFE